MTEPGFVPQGAAGDAEALLIGIEERAGLGRYEIESVLTSFHLSLVAAPAPPRSLRLHRLRISGVKTKVANAGPFDKTFLFGPGVTALVTEKNLRGKTSVLEIITWCLRGSPRKLRVDVRSWLRFVALDVVVSRQPIGLRLAMGDGGLHAVVLTGSDIRELTSVDTIDAELPSNVRVVARTDTEPEFRMLITRMMMDRLKLEPFANWQRYPGEESEGRAQAHGWPAYFSAIYLPNAGDNVLLGDQTMGGLPGRLLQLFCDVPLAVTYTHAQVVRQQLAQDERGRSRRAAQDATARSGQRQQVETELAEAQRALAELSMVDSTDVGQIVAELEAAEQQLVRAREMRRRNAATLSEVTAQRQADQRIQQDGLETALARRLFQGLRPRHCPRCEAEFGEERTSVEREEHCCAVCTAPLALDLPLPAPDVRTMDAQLPEQRESDDATDLADRVEALFAAEEAAHRALADADQETIETQRLVNELTARLAEQSAAKSYTQRRDLELTVARLTGTLAAQPALGPEESVPVALKVMTAATAVLDDYTKEAAGTLFDELNAEVLRLGRAFGIDTLERVALARGARLRVWTAAQETSFTHLSRGERLRLRVAVIVALLRVGGRRGIGTHPGLLLLDSPAAEELTHDDARALISELHRLHQELPDLQTVVATAAPDVVAGLIPESQTYRADGGQPLW